MKKTLFTIASVLFLIQNLTAKDLDTLNTKYEKPDSIKQDSVSDKYIIPPSQELLKDPELVEPDKFNPLVSAGLSTVLPGIGQLYCRRTFRGLFYMASEAIAASYLFNRIWVYDKYSWDNINTSENTISLYEDSLKIFISTEKYSDYYDLLISAHMEYDLAKHRQTADRYVIYQCIGWAAGIYLWNISDALHCSNAFYDNKPKNPGTALCLSAIPFLGLGQIYNGSFSKAGLIWTFHTMWAFMAWNNNKLMNKCINKRNQITNTSSVSQDVKIDYQRSWDSEYDNAFSKRNSYLWYLIIFWFYGMFDAAVDAHLHDYKTKIRLEPDIDTKNETAGFRMYINF
jgi:hypothetical protein